MNADDRAPRPGAEALAEPLRSRWSPSLFDEEHTLGADDVELLLQAARWSPSRGNLSPWGLAVAVRGDAVHRAFVPHLSRGNAGWVPRATLVLIGGVDLSEEPDFARYDLGQAAAHLTLQAQAMGLHAHQFAGFDHAAAAAALAVPDHVALMAGIAVGVRARAEQVARSSEREREREQRERTRKPLGEIAFGGRWGEPWRA